MEQVWSIFNQQCVRSLPCGYGISCTFLLSSRFVAVGTKRGAIQIFSMASSDLVCEITDAHRGAVWSLAVQPGGGTLLSASADKTLGVWLPVEQEGDGLALQPERSLELGDDVLCANFSADGKYVAAALLDASVRLPAEQPHRTPPHQLPPHPSSLQGMVLFQGPGPQHSPPKWYGGCHWIARPGYESDSRTTWIRKA